MPNPTEINLLNYHFEAKACDELLTAMLNHSDFDYVTVDELRHYSELSQFTFDELRTAVYELCKRGFLLVVQKPCLCGQQAANIQYGICVRSVSRGERNGQDEKSKKDNTRYDLPGT